jgi:hypothetical protein
MLPTEKRANDSVSGAESILMIQLADGADLAVRMSPVVARCVGIYARLPEFMLCGPLLKIIRTDESTSVDGG